MSFHLHAEAKIYGVWEHFHCCNNDAFAATVKALAETIKNRGFPEDATVLSQRDCGFFSHSYSWLSAEEIATLTGSVPMKTPECVEDVRFIFWFDD